MGRNKARIFDISREKDTYELERAYGIMGVSIYLCASLCVGMFVYIYVSTYASIRKKERNNMCVCVCLGFDFLWNGGH